MAIIELKPGESLTVKLFETDGEFEIHYDTKEHPNALVVKETAGLPGSIKGDADSILYHEDWSDCSEVAEVLYPET
jgi:hypothetical protein